MYDLLIKNARVADGLGSALRGADVAVSNGRIADIGGLSGAAHETIDADGLVLAPGIIDLHTHYDAQLTWDRTASPSPSLGVTTAVMGNCGFGIAPAPAEHRQTIARNLSEVEGMSLAALEQGIDWDFSSFADYLDLLRRKGSFPNVAVFVGHSTVRSAVMGRAASERAANEDEIAAMRLLVLEALAAGAIGFASSQSLSHNGYGGIPMPSRLAEDGEFHSLLGALAEAGKGVFQMTVGPTDSIAFLEQLAASSGRPVIFSALFYNATFPQRAPGMLAQCLEARSRGHEIYAQVACQPLSMDFTLANAYPLQSLEVWEQLRTNDKRALVEALANRDFRAAFRRQLAEPALGKLFYGNWSQMEVAQVVQSENRPLEGASIEAIAAESSSDPVDVFFDLALAEALQTVFSAKLLNVEEEHVEPLLKHEASVISLSDAGAHLAYLCDAGFGLTLLGRWVRERQAFTLVEAVRQLTSLPAELYGIVDRGRIETGACADLMLFDPDQVGVSGLKRCNDLPGGESRLLRESKGMHGVWVNGVRVWEGTDYCQPAAAPGEILTAFAS